MEGWKSRPLEIREWDKIEGKCSKLQVKRCKSEGEEGGYSTTNKLCKGEEGGYSTTNELCEGEEGGYSKEQSL